MTTLTREILFSEEKESHLESSGWLTALGIFFLIATISYEVAGNVLANLSFAI